MPGNESGIAGELSFAIVTILGGAGVVTMALPKKRRALTDFPSDAGNEEKQNRGKVILYD